MRFKRPVTLVFIFVSMAGFFAIATFTFFSYIPETPDKEIDEARIALAGAREARAEHYAPELFAEATALYDSAINDWRYQNQRFVLRRSFSKTVSLALASEIKADRAKLESVEKSRNFELNAQMMISTVEKQVKVFDNVFGTYPIKPEILKPYQQGKLLLSEAKIAYDGGNLFVCNDRLKQAQTLVEKASILAKEMLEDYFGNYSKWLRWKNETIEYSKNNHSPAIIVDKISKTCYLYHNGNLTRTFDIELGKNWIGTKRQKGDRATPEGKYSIVKKKSGHQTKYYKALLLNYPNEEDKRRFQAEKKNGTISRKADIGGLIEIHAGGGKGEDWTSGCVALTNRDMDVLFDKVGVGTPVTIVGSLESMSEILK